MYYKDNVGSVLFTLSTSYRDDMHIMHSQQYPECIHYRVPHSRWRRQVPELIIFVVN